MTESMSELRGHVAMWCFIAAETAVFTIFVVAYLFYVGKSVAGPRAGDVLSAPIAASIGLLSSSLTVHAGVTALRDGRVTAFTGWWLLTLALGAAFLGSTAVEWHRLIYVDGLTVHTNLFGTTYFSLVGLHALHLTVGLAGLAFGSTLALLGLLTPAHASRTGVFSLYWHFVDAVWVVVFLVVYVPWH